jgi:hypothetical protein
MTAATNVIPAYRKDGLWPWCFTCIDPSFVASSLLAKIVDDSTEPAGTYRTGGAWGAAIQWFYDPEAFDSIADTAGGFGDPGHGTQHR